MTLQASGAISLSNVQTEFGGSNPISISEYYGKATGIPASGQISLSHFYGKSAAFVFNQTISSPVNDYILRSAAIAAGWDGVKPLIATVTVNNFVGSSSAGSWAFQTGSPFPAGSSISIVNNHWICGKGGVGGNSGVGGNDSAAAVGSAGATGGYSFYAAVACTVTNNGAICAGGGGGGGGGVGIFLNPCAGTADYAAGGGGGGGSGVSSTGGGSGYVYGGTSNYYSGGAGGAGASGANGNLGGAGGAGGSYGGAGGAGGYAVAGNSNITWAAAGSRYGIIA